MKRIAFICLFSAAIAACAAEEPKPNPDVKVHRKPAALAAGAVAKDWVQFLGPTHNLVSPETHIKKEFPKEGPPLLWEMSRGTSYASPAVQGDHLVYAHRLKDEEVIECLHPETGARYWRFTYATQYSDRFGYNNGPRASPVIDGNIVFTYGAEGWLHALELKTGTVVWKKNVTADYNAKQDFFGVACTPLLEGNTLIINVGAPDGPCVVALDKTSGKEVWRAGKEWGPSYASPIPAVVHGERRVFVFAGGESKPPTGGLLCINPATGAVDFSYPWRSQSYESVNAACPVINGDRVFITASYETGGAMLKITPGFKHEVAWTTEEFGSHFSTPLYKDGYLYGFDGRHSQNAELVCVDAATGKTLWRDPLRWEEKKEIGGRERTITKGAARGQLLWVEGRVLCVGEFGHLWWLELTPQGCKQICRTELFYSPETWSVPVLCRGLLYVSQNHEDRGTGSAPRLLCYDLRGE